MGLIQRPIVHEAPTVSVVIPTLPETELLCLDSLREQTVEGFEVVVVEDASLDICEARNIGREAASAAVVAHTDDDCRPPPDWVQLIDESFQDDDSLVLLEGPLDKYGPGPRRYVGANIAYRTDAAEAIGGFDSAVAGWGDDKDFGWRMEKAYGLARCRFRRDLEAEHVGAMRSELDVKKEATLRYRHPFRYYRVTHDPQNPVGRVAYDTIAAATVVSPHLGDFLRDIFPYYHSPHS
ncbi:glycosyltransferase [Salinigranum halophilum]|uniref:glycosyltransferase n=1 Tax=Salinigranum halophilum TaxID=2565931 RepID=UPI0010A7B9E2|nr:glycosyltransferase family A protein [Salinigranum halophilum]